MKQDATILIVDGTGKTGRRLSDRLAALGCQVRIASPSADQRFVWEEEATWRSALEGIDGLYIAHYDITRPDAGDQIGQFSRLALASGVRRQILLSGRADDAFMSHVERGMRANGADWTILRPSWFMQNFSEMFFYDAVMEGTIALPVGDATEPFIDVEDVAAVAAEALSDNRHIGQTYELTGSQLLGFAEAAEILTKALGREITYSPITLDAFQASVRAHGLPEEYGYVYSGIADGKLAYVTDDVERILGRPPISFADYAERTAETGVWAM